MYECAELCGVEAENSGAKQMSKDLNLMENGYHSIFSDEATIVCLLFQHSIFFSLCNDYIIVCRKLMIARFIRSSSLTIIVCIFGYHCCVLCERWYRFDTLASTLLFCDAMIIILKLNEDKAHWALFSHTHSTWTTRNPIQFNSFIFHSRTCMFCRAAVTCLVLPSPYCAVYRRVTGHFFFFLSCSNKIRLIWLIYVRRGSFLYGPIMLTLKHSDRNETSLCWYT